MKEKNDVPLFDLNSGDCPCTGHNLDKLVQPAILTVLARHDVHGYVLVQQLSEMRMFGGQKPDMAGVYRCLRQMEERGLLSSTWDTSDAGPAKRLYHLTEEGWLCLTKWTNTLALYRDAIGALLELSWSVLQSKPS